MLEKPPESLCGLMQAYYPERLHKVYILNMPWFFVNVWKVISRFLEKATLEKVYTSYINWLFFNLGGLCCVLRGYGFLQVMIVTDEEERRELVAEVGEATLPDEYGGRAKLVPVQDVTLPPLEV